MQGAGIVLGIPNWKALFFRTDLENQFAARIQTDLANIFGAVHKTPS